MRTIHLIVTTATGDVLGRLPLAGVQLAAAGEHSHSPGSHPVAGVNQLLGRLKSTIQNEGLEPTLDDLDLQISISRELLQQTGDTAVELRVAVRERKERTAPPTPDGPKRPALPGGDILDGVFEVDDLLDFQEGGDDA